MIASDFVVRVARHDDLEAVLAVLATKGSVPSVPPGERQRRTWSEMMDRPGLTIYVASVDTEVIGTATLLVMPNLTYDCAPTAFIEAVVVDPRHRRRGCATAILERALADARAEGCNKVQLLSHKRHAGDGAHALYRALGFEPQAEGFRLYLLGRPPQPQ